MRNEYNISGIIADARARHTDKNEGQIARVAALQEAQRPALERALVSDTIANTKAQLDQESEAGINAAFAGMQLDSQYKTALTDLDSQYKTAKSAANVGYDDAGNPIAFEETEAGRGYKKQQEAFEAKYKDYRNQIDVGLAQANAQARGIIDAGYDPTKFTNRMQAALVQGGLGLEQAQAQATAAASPYAAVPLTDNQKAARDSQIKNNESVLEAELKRAGELSKGNLRAGGSVVTGTDADGNNIYSSGGSTKSGAARSKYEPIEESRARVMKEFDNIGYGYWKDNKDIVSDILNPLHNELGGQVSAGEITDAIIASKDDGFIKDTLKSGTSKESIKKYLVDKITSKRSAGAKGTLGKAGISNEEYTTLIDGIKEKSNKSLASILSNFQGAGTKGTGLANLQTTIGNLNNVVATPAEQKKVTGTTGTTKAKSLFTDNSDISKAMNSKAKGKLADALVSDPEKFGVEFEALNTAQQKSVVKVLESKNSKSIIDALYKEVNTDPDKILTDALDVAKESKTKGGVLTTGVTNSNDYKTQLKNLKHPKDFKGLTINELEKVIRTQKERHPAGTRASSFAEKELNLRNQNAVRGQKLSRYINHQ